MQLLVRARSQTTRCLLKKIFSLFVNNNSGEKFSSVNLKFRVFHLDSAQFVITILVTVSFYHVFRTLFVVSQN